MVDLCVSILTRQKHKTKCQFQWVLVGVLWLFQSVRVTYVIGCYHHLRSLYFILIKSIRGEDRVLRNGGGRAYDHLSHDKSPQASLFKPSCQCMHHFPLITLCTVMSPVACDEKIDAFIFTNGSPVITAPKAHSNIGTRETQWKPHERRAWYVKVQEMRFSPKS